MLSIMVNNAVSCIHDAHYPLPTTHYPEGTQFLLGSESTVLKNVGRASKSFTELSSIPKSFKTKMYTVSFTL